MFRAENPAVPDFLQKLREAVNARSGETRMQFAFLTNDDAAAAVAEASTALSWRVSPTVFQTLRQHPAVTDVLIDTRRLELKQSRWGKGR